jgi:hypothetical protein
MREVNVMREVPEWASVNRFNDPGHITPYHWPLITPYIIDRELQKVAREFGVRESFITNVVDKAREYLSYPSEHLTTCLDWFSDVYIVPAVRGALRRA